MRIELDPHLKAMEICRTHLRNCSGLRHQMRVRYEDHAALLSRNENGSVTISHTQTRHTRHRTIKRKGEIERKDESKQLYFAGDG